MDELDLQQGTVKWNPAKHDVAALQDALEDLFQVVGSDLGVDDMRSSAFIDYAGDHMVDAHVPRPLIDKAKKWLKRYGGIGGKIEAIVNLKRANMILESVKSNLSSAPQKIRGRGLDETIRLLREAEHERCPDGQHWNEFENKCIPVAVHSVSTKAREAGKHASTIGSLAPRREAMKVHDNARDKHRRAAEVARKHGFHELARMHTTRAAQHDASAASASMRDEYD